MQSIHTYSRLRLGMRGVLFGLPIAALLFLPQIAQAYTAKKITIEQVRKNEDLRPFQNCNMGKANPNLLWCDFRGRRQAIDLSLCVPGSLRLENVYPDTSHSRLMACDARHASGSYARSCSRMKVHATPFVSTSPSARTGDVVYVSYCSGPKIKLTLRESFKVLRENGISTLSYGKGFGATPYRNQLPAHSCSTHRFWNDLGQLRCAK